MFDFKTQGVHWRPFYIFFQRIFKMGLTTVHFVIKFLFLKFLSLTTVHFADPPFKGPRVISILKVNLNYALGNVPLSNRQQDITSLYDSMNNSKLQTHN